MKSFSGFSCVLFAALFAVFLVAGCSDDDGPSGPTTPDTTPPIVNVVMAVHSFAVEVTFNENVTRATAERASNYKMTDNIMAAANAPNHSGDNRSPSAELNIASAALYPDQRTVLLSIVNGLSVGDYSLEVEKVSDVHGNIMTESSTTDFTGNDAADGTPPTMTYHDPGSGAAGVGTAQAVFITFSEPMQSSTVYSAFSWMASGSRVSFGMHQLSANTYVFRAVSPIELNTTYTINVSSAAMDRANNPFAGTNWNFKTGSTPDTTPPTFVSSIPVDGVTDVPVDTALKLEFSEPINPLSLEEVVLSPETGDGLIEWIDGGKTFVFIPDDGFSVNTQYALTLPEGGIKDLAGNSIAETVTIRFTTGASFATGSFAGTLAGDPFSVQASDPTGAIVVATTTNLFGREEEGDIDIYGTGTVGADDTYLVDKLPDNVYYPFAIMDSNNDGILNPELGDAFGVYGVDIRNMDESAIPVDITSGAAITSIDFPLFDPNAIFGTIFYAGQIYTGELYNFSYYVGAFDVSGFDPENPGNPDAATDGESLAQYPFYRIDTFNGDLMPGSYYLGAYLDVNGNEMYDPAIDPIGFYSNPDNGNLLPVTVENGGDAGDIDIYLEDPAAGGSPAMQSAWTSAGDDRSPRVRRAMDAIRRAMEGFGGK